MHPSGEPIEVYIVTSTNGGQRIRERVLSSYPSLIGRLDTMLIELSPPDQPNEIELKELPSLLYAKYDMKIVNHDGGKVVLEKFCNARIVPQINLTLCRKKSLYDVISDHSLLSQESKTRAIHLFQSHVQYFFTESSKSEVKDESEVPTKKAKTDKDECHVGIPSTFHPVYVVTDDPEDVAVVTFDTRQVTHF